MSLYMNKGGFYSNDHIVTYTTNGSATGSRICLGFFGAISGQNYIHVKTSVGGSADTMCKFEYDGYTYSDLNIHNSVTLYTYNGSSTPYQPSLVNWGETTGGIVNYYYSSSDDKVVIVLQTSGAYTGGFLYFQSGRSHENHSVDVLAYGSSNNISGVF